METTELMNLKKNPLTYLNILMGISLWVGLFHILILVRVIPFEITWGGRLKSVEEMYVFETLSILILSFFIFVLLQKGGYIGSFWGKKTINRVLWIFFVLFVLNTVGNVFAKTEIEKLFTLITLANSVLIWLILTQNTKEIP